MFRSILTFVHGMAYASLILVSCFAYGMYTAQVTARAQMQQATYVVEEPVDYLTQLDSKSKR